MLGVCHARLMVVCGKSLEIDFYLFQQKGIKVELSWFSGSACETLYFLQTAAQLGCSQKLYLDVVAQVMGNWPQFFFFNISGSCF